MNPTSEAWDSSGEASINAPHTFTLETLLEQTANRPSPRRTDSSSSAVTVIYSPIPSPCHQQSTSIAEGSRSPSHSPEPGHSSPSSSAVTAKTEGNAKFHSFRSLVDVQPSWSKSPSTQSRVASTRVDQFEAHTSQPASTTEPLLDSPTPFPALSAPSVATEETLYGPYTVPVRRRARADSEQFPAFAATKPSNPSAAPQAPTPTTPSTIVPHLTTQNDILALPNTSGAHVRSASNGSAFIRSGYSSSQPPTTQPRTRGRARSTTLTSQVNPLEEPLTAEEQAVSNLAQAINKQNRREAAQLASANNGGPIRSPLDLRGNAASRSPRPPRHLQTGTSSTTERFHGIAELSDCGQSL